MISENENLLFANRGIGRWNVPTLAFRDAERPNLLLPVMGCIVNSITERKDRLQSWKAHIASEVKEARGIQAWDARDVYIITLGFSFNINSGRHGYRPLDVENFVKPVIDALAAGLFCSNSTEPRSIQRWDCDDSNFNTLLIHRLPDARTHEDEGIAISVSAG